MPGVGAIVLAAGASARMGQPKQLLRVQGKTLLRRAAETAAEVGCEPIVVVLREMSAELLAELRGLAVHPIENPEADKGIGTSIRAGVGSLLKISPNLQSLVILLCDQPRVNADTLHRLIDSHRANGKPVSACAFTGTIGPPVLVESSLLSKLQSLRDDQGAKALWLAQPEIIHRFACEEAAIDVDTPEDYQRLN